MSRARSRALMAAGAAMVAIIAFAAVQAPREPVPPPPRPPGERPALLLLTSLPLLFGDDFSLRQTGSPAARALSARYRMVPISVAAPSELAKGRLLLMAQPRAQPAEDLVALDQWVRGGGRVLLLADPMLEWPSELALGDPARPPPMFMDTGLRAHWGLRLEPAEQRVPSTGKLGGFDVVTLSPGRLSGACGISKDRLVARCAIGRGRAVVVADSDLLDVARLGEKARHNLDGLIAELALLEPRAIR